MTPLSQDCLCRELRLALQAAEVDTSGYSGPEPDAWSLEVGSIPVFYLHRSGNSYQHFTS